MRRVPIMRTRLMAPLSIGGLAAIVVATAIWSGLPLTGLVQPPAATPYPVGTVTAGSLSATVLGSLEQIAPAGLPVGSVGADLVAAGNEFESFQVAIGGTAGALSGVDVSIVPGTMPAAWVTLYLEDSVDLAIRSDREGSAGRWRDALVPKVDPIYRQARNRFPFSVPAGENRVVWADVLVPQGQPAGRYEAGLTVTSSAGTLTLPIRVTVLGMSLPSTTSIASLFLTEYGNPCLAHTGDKLCSGNEELRWSLQSLYARVALEDRVTIANPWPLGINQGPPAVGSAARTRFDRYVLPLLTGASPADPAGQWSPVRLAGARLTSASVHWDCLTSGTCLADWKALAASAGFADRLVYYACDEVPSSTCPDWATFKQRAAAANATSPRIPVLVTGTIDDADAAGATDLVDVIVPIIARLEDKAEGGKPGYAGDQRPDYDAFVAGAGNRLWAYTSCLSFGCGSGDSPEAYWDGWPGYAIDAPASQHRAMGWLAVLHRFSGELYWHSTQSLATAWNDCAVATCQFWDGANGDGNLFYPGKACTVASDRACIGGPAGTDIPIESVRLKRIRDGREDAEWLLWLSSRGRGTEATAIAAQLFPTAYSTTRTAAAVEAARRQLADLIAAIATPTATATPGTAPTPTLTPIPETTITTAPATPTSNPSATVTFSASDPAATFECRLDAGAYAACASPATFAGLATGSHTVSVRARNATGADATPASATWLVDLVAPVAVKPGQTITGPMVRVDQATSKVPVGLAWSATDTGGSGIARYELQQTTDKGLTWVPVTLPAATAVSSARQLSVGSTYGYRVRAVDKAGNAGAWATGPNFLVAVYQETHAAVKYNVAWNGGTSTSYWSGTDRYAGTAGRTATFSVGNALSVAWIGYRATTHGQATVSIDGGSAVTYDTYGASSQFQAVIWQKTWATAANHTIKITVLGTAGRTRVDIDAFVVLHLQ